MNIMQILALLRMMLSTVVEVNDQIGRLFLLIKKAEQEGRDVTDAELDAINANVAASRARLAALLQ
jgi:hypothetical protein